MKKHLFDINPVLLFFLVAVLVAGCGYTTHSTLPGGADTIHVENFQNKIDVTQETSESKVYVLYRPGTELDITREVIDKFIMDGNIQIRDEENADLILSGDLVDFRKEVLRYDANENPIEFRIEIAVDIQLEDRKTGDILWTEKNFAGDAIYRTTGQYASSEGTASFEAIKDLARRIVERTVEGW